MIPQKTVAPTPVGYQLISAFSTRKIAGDCGPGRADICQSLQTVAAAAGS